MVGNAVRDAAGESERTGVVGRRIGAFFLDMLVPLVAGGATAGKLVTGIRVQRLDGTRPRSGPLLVRWLFLLIDGVFTLCICGLFTMLKTEDEQRLGDMAAGTVVVRRRES